MRRRIDEAVQHMCQAEGGEDADEMAVLGRLFTSIQSTVTDYTTKKDEIEGDMKRQVEAFHSKQSQLSSITDDLLPGIEYPYSDSMRGSPSYEEISILLQSRRLTGWKPII